MFLNKKLLTIIGAASMALGVSACSNSSSALGVCTHTEDDGSASCGGTVAIDGVPFEEPAVPGVPSVQEICELGADETAGTADDGVWSDSCATDFVCSVVTDYSVTDFTWTATTEIGESAADDVDTEGEILSFVCPLAATCYNMDDDDTINTSFTNSLGVTTTTGLDGDCAL